MKRYIRSDYDYDRLAYEKDGRIEHLPTWYYDKSDEELEELKQRLINAKPAENSESYDFDARYDEKDIRKQLRAEGFGKAAIDEIIVQVRNGATMDSAIQRQLGKSVHASMDVEELENAILNGRPFEADEFSEYWDAYHQPEEDAITAAEVNEDDIIENTEDASEINIGDVFHVDTIQMHAPDWEEFDYEFGVTLLNGDYKGNHVKLHYMADEYVGVRSDLGRALGIYNSTSIKANTRKAGARHREVSNDLRSILEDVMIDTLDDFSGRHILVEFIENARYLQDWDEYGDEHAEEMLELKKLSDVALADIGAEILDEISAGWDQEEV